MKVSFPKDIFERVQHEFGSDQEEALEHLSNLKSACPHLKDRIFRCVIFLSKGSMEKLTHHIEVAKVDWRDVVYWAEYDRDGQTQRHDFTKPFSK